VSCELLAEEYFIQGGCLWKGEEWECCGIENGEVTDDCENDIDEYELTCV
jgi:hypothetical protein